MFRFPGQMRIAHRNEISEVRRYGNVWRCSWFTVFAKANNDKSSRLAVLVGRKTGPSVVRNRQKRIFREIFRLNPWQGPPFFDVLIAPQKLCQSAAYKELNEQYCEWKKTASK